MNEISVTNISRMNFPLSVSQVFPPAVVAPRQPGRRWFPRIVPKAWNHPVPPWRVGLGRWIFVMKMDGCMSFMREPWVMLLGWKWWDLYNSCSLSFYDLGSKFITQPTEVLSIAHLDVAKFPTCLFGKNRIEGLKMVFFGVRCGFQNVFKMCVWIWCSFDRCVKIVMIYQSVFQNRMKIITWLTTSDWPICSYMDIKQQWQVNCLGKGLQVSFSLSRLVITSSIHKKELII